MKNVDLYLESASDYRITKVVGQLRSTITPEEARKLYESGAVRDFNMAFERLIDSNFDVEAVKAYYQKASARITPTKRGFSITRNPCAICGEPPFGSEYACGHSQPATA